MGFLILEHTHEDIDGYYIYLSRKLQKNNTCFGGHHEKFHGFTILDFHIKEDIDFVQEVGDFKEFIKLCHHEGTNALV